MKKSVLYALAAVGMAPAISMVAAEPAQAQSAGDILEDVFCRGDCDRQWERSQRRAERNADRRYNDRVNERRNRERNLRQVPEATMRYVQRNGGDYYAIRDCAARAVMYENVRANTAVNFCATQFGQAARNNGNVRTTQPQYNEDVYRRARQQQGQRGQSDVRITVTYEEFNRIVERCARDLTRENRRISYEAAQTVCARSAQDRVTIGRSR